MPTEQIKLKRAGTGLRAWPWFFATGWGFFNCLISGRRKAVYFVVVFAAVFVWRYFVKLKRARCVVPSRRVTARSRQVPAHDFGVAARNV